MASVTPRIPWKWLFFVSLFFNLSVLFSFVVFQTLDRAASGSSKAYHFPLSQEQKQAIQAIRRAYRVNAQPIRAELKHTRQVLWQTLTQAQPDSTVLDSLKKRIVELDYTLRQYIYHYYIREMLVLTPQQRQERLKGKIAQP